MPDTSHTAAVSVDERRVAYANPKALWRSIVALTPQQ